MTVDRFRRIGAVCGPLSGRNDAQQRDAMLTNDEYFRWSTSVSGL